MTVLVSFHISALYQKKNFEIAMQKKLKQGMYLLKTEKKNI